MAALLAAESARQETYPRTVGAVAITLILYWLAHSYSEFTGERLERGEPFSYSGFRAPPRRSSPSCSAPRSRSSCS